MQRVGFRRWLQREAQARNLTGWVRNRADGSVEAVAFGSAEAIEALAELCRRGPRGAVVRSVESSVRPASESEEKDFTILPTL